MVYIMPSVKLKSLQFSLISLKIIATVITVNTYIDFTL